MFKTHPEIGSATRGAGYMQKVKNISPTREDQSINRKACHATDNAKEIPNLGENWRRMTKNLVVQHFKYIDAGPVVLGLYPHKLFLTLKKKFGRMNRTFGVPYHPDYSVCQTELAVRAIEHSVHVIELCLSVHFIVEVRLHEPKVRFDEPEMWFDEPEFWVDESAIRFDEPDIRPLSAQPKCEASLVKLGSQEAHLSCHKACLAIADRADIIRLHYSEQSAMARLTVDHCSGFTEGRCFNVTNWRRLSLSACRCRKGKEWRSALACRTGMNFGRNLENAKIMAGNVWDVNIKPALPPLPRRLLRAWSSQNQRLQPRE
ncbi:unnamed protein product [Bemisia tabaci]|uniref:Uncharacterized protein n=1 Tax=Bemisia tabaci TaxID=7038 RepID=A0A9P0F7P3_BEMTA|nr:unnamed protein product [Bemisia tabaci]